MILWQSIFGEFLKKQQHTSIYLLSAAWIILTYTGMFIWLHKLTLGQTGTLAIEANVFGIAGMVVSFMLVIAIVAFGARQ